VAHAAVKEQIEQDPIVRAAFETMIETSTSSHHAEHVLAAMLMEAQCESAQAIEVGKGPEKAWIACKRKLQELVRDSTFRKKLTRQFSGNHSALEYGGSHRNHGNDDRGDIAL
jgi:hypothetical protein